MINEKKRRKCKKCRKKRKTPGLAWGSEDFSGAIGMSMGEGILKDYILEVLKNN